MPGGVNFHRGNILEFGIKIAYFDKKNFLP